MFRKKVISFSFLWFISLTPFIVLSALHLKVSDETNWVDGGQKYLSAILSLSPEKTYIPEVSHRLGVTVLWISAFIHNFFYTASPENILIIHRLMFAFLNLSLFFMAVKLIRKYIKTSHLILFVAYLLLNRFYFVMGRSTWLDQLLVSFGLLGTIFWVIYLDNKKGINLFYSGFLFGFTLLTKYAGWFFPLLTILLSVLYSLRYKQDFKELIKPLFITILISILTFIIFYPVMWVDPQKGFFNRFDDGKRSIQQVADIWSYINQIKYYDPMLIIGSALVIADFKKIKNKFLQLLGMYGLLYIGFFITVCFSLGFLHRLNYPFLQGVYRYTWPAIPYLSLYTFSRLDFFVKNNYLRRFFIFCLFLREILLSPIFNL